MEDIYETGVIPKGFCSSRIVTLPKNNKADSCTDFRTLSLLLHVSKILIKIIYRRIYRIIKPTNILEMINTDSGNKKELEKQY